MLLYNIEILGISEMRWKGSGELTTMNNNTVLYSGNTEKHEKGVGLLITKQIKHSLHSWKPISDRVIMANFYSKVHRYITVIQFYAATESAEGAVKDAFYDTLSATLSQVQKSAIFILMGDFNAKIGNNNLNLRQTMGTQGCGTRNNNGDRLTDLCQSFRLVIGGSIFPHKNIHKYTWTSPSGNARNQIDHICVSSKWRSSLMDVRNKRGADIDSDHELIIADLRIKLNSKRVVRTSCRQKRFNTGKLLNNEIKAQYNAELNAILANSGDASWEQITNRVKQVALNNLGYEFRNKKQPWISNNTWSAIKDRNVLKIHLVNNNAMTSVYREAAKKVKKLARLDKRTYYTNLATAAEEAAGANNMKELHRIINDLTQHKSNFKQPIRSKSGELLTNDDHQLQRWREHFELISNPDTNGELLGEEVHTNNSKPNAGISSLTPSINEIKAAIHKLKRSKAAGDDGIPAELFLTDTDVCASILHPHIAAAWESENFPTSWTKGIVIKLPKKGDLRECGNWRGITLLNTIYKIVATIILDRLQPVEGSLRDEQAGFRPHRSCVDQANTLRIIIEQSLEWNTPLYMVFIDFQKAFDTIKRTAIWSSLRKKGVPTKIVQIIKALYYTAELTVLHNGATSTPFRTTSGVKQGCPLSPLLFAVTLDEVMQCVEKRSPGIAWTLSRQLHDLDYADDICLLSHRHSDMQAKIDFLVTAARNVGLEINNKKTVAMRINNTNPNNIVIEGEAVQYVESFCYLGSIISTNGGAEEDAENRVRKARSAFGRLQPIWKNRQISQKTKIRVFNACVKSTLLYGSETWLVSRSITQKLQSFINKCLRIICKVFWPNTIRNTDLWQITEQDPIQKVIRCRKWRWIGHTLRKDKESISRTALEWNPQGHRRPGRPRNTWRRSNLRELEAANQTWDVVKITAVNRIRFKCFVEALCSQVE